MLSCMGNKFSFFQVFSDFYFKCEPCKSPLVPRATLRRVAELHVASDMAQWRMFDLLLFLDENKVIPEFRHFSKVTSPDEELFTVLYFPSDAFPMT